MAFNIERGLAAMGEAVGKVAGDALLDQQRAELQKESMILANQLASERESKGRAEAHGYDMEKQTAQQTFMAGENEKTRAADLQRTNISAGASIAVANIGLKGRQMEIDAMAPVRQAQIEASKTAAEGGKLDNELKSNQAKARQELETATATGDQGAIEAAKAKVAIYDEGAALRAAQAKGLAIETQAKEIQVKAGQLIQDAKDELLNAGDDQAKAAEARRKLRILESSSKDDRQEIALYQQQAKLAETAMTATMTRLTTLQGQGLLTPESKALEQTLQKILQQQQREFTAATRRAKAMLDALDPDSSRATSTGEKPPLSSLIKLPTVTGKPEMSPMPPSLINSTGMGTP